jgi:hypothetical protein
MSVMAPMQLQILPHVAHREWGVVYLHAHPVEEDTEALKRHRPTSIPRRPSQRLPITPPWALISITFYLLFRRQCGHAEPSACLQKLLYPHEQRPCTS